MKKRLFPFLIVIFLALFPAFAGAATFDNLIAFGDSLSDNGNVGRATNGQVWVEYLSQDLDANLHNFAQAGAETVNNTESPPIPLGLKQQVWTYALFSEYFPSMEQDALYTVWAGGNDLLRITDPSETLSVIGTAVTNIAFSVGTLAYLGADDILVLNMPDLGLIPRFNHDAELAAGATALSSFFNTLLDRALFDPENGLAGRYPDTRFHYLDTFSLLHEVLDDALGGGSLYGVTNAWDTWLGSGDDPATYLFFDGIHPTTRGHEIIASAAGELFATPTPVPGTLFLFGSGFVGFFALKRRSSTKATPIP